MSDSSSDAFLKREYPPMPSVEDFAHLLHRLHRPSRHLIVFTTLPPGLNLNLERQALPPRGRRQNGGGGLLLPSLVVGNAVPCPFTRCDRVATS